MILKILMQTNVMIMSIINFEDNKMTEKRFVVKGNWIEDRCIGKLLNIDFNTNADAVLCCDLLNNIENKKLENGRIATKLLEENEQLKSENQRVSEQKHIYKQDWKHVCIDKELLDSENEQLKSRVDDLKELNKIYVDFMVNEGYELADVMGKCDVE